MVGHLYCWSVFSEPRQMDFNGHLWVRPEGNILIDPPPMIASDLAQLHSLGKTQYIVITNRDHEREALFFQKETGAQIVIHTADASQLAHPADRTITDQEAIVPGLIAISLHHGKSPGEIALYFSEEKIILFGDHVIGRPMGALSFLEAEKFQNPNLAREEVQKLLSLSFDAVLVGDGHSILTYARESLTDCLNRARATSH